MMRAILLAIVFLGSGMQQVWAVPTGTGNEVLSGNVGIGTTNPGQALDVQGAIRATLLSGNGSGLVNINNYWLNNAGSVSVNTTYAVGLGTIAQSNDLNILGNIGIAKTSGGSFLTTAAPNGGMLIEGNVGIGSLAPGQPLDIQGVGQVSGFVLSGNGAGSSNVLISNGVGLGTWMPVTTLPNGTITAALANEVAFYSGTSTINGNTKFEFNGTNVGIGTNSFSASLTVLGNVGIGTVGNGDKYLLTNPPSGGLIAEGNVGISTIFPAALFQAGDFSSSVRGFMIDANGNAGIGTNTVSAALSIMNNGNVGIGTWVPSSAFVLNKAAATNGLDFTAAQTGTSSNTSGGWVVRDTSGNVRQRGYVDSSGIPHADVVNNASTAGAVLGNFEGINISSTNTDKRVSFLQFLTGSDANHGKIAFYTCNGTNGQFIPNIIADGSGNTFIGGTSSVNNAASIYPASALDVGGNVTVGTDTVYATIKVAPANGMIVDGNVGIGTLTSKNVLDVNGAIGIGTAYAGLQTAPIDGLVVSGKIGIGTWAPTNSLIVKAGNVGINTANAHFNLEIGGCATKTGTTSCVDVAELIPSSQRVGSGDVVMLDPNQAVMVRKADQGHNALLFGVVTTDPAIVIEGATVGILNGNGYTLDPFKPAVALAGRIPVKVNLDNGPIQAGDMIAVSKTPGIGARAIVPGRVLGMALEPMRDLKGKSFQQVLMYVNPSWWYAGSLWDKDGAARALAVRIQHLIIENEILEKQVQQLEQKTSSSHGH